MTRGIDSTLNAILIRYGVFRPQALMNYSAYAPLHKLRGVLEEKGFCKKSDRPTIFQVRFAYY
jgi:hypothetical protein